MSIALADTRAPRTPGSRYGSQVLSGSGSAKLYGEPGDRCRCGALLSKYNSVDACNCCGGGSKRKRRTSASADGSVVTTAAPESCRVSQEAIDMAAEQRREARDLRDGIEAFARENGEGWFTSAQCQVAVDCANSAARRHLGDLVKSGVLESSTRKGYRLRRDVVAERPVKVSSEGEKSAKAPDTVKDEAADRQGSEPETAPDIDYDPAPDTSPAPAPDPPSGAAPDAAASDSASPELQGPPSFGEHEYTAASPEDIAEAMRRACTAADETITVDWAETRIGCTRLTEAAVIGWFEDAGRVERRRVLDYLLERW